VRPGITVLDRPPVPWALARLLAPEGAVDLLRSSGIDVEQARPEYVRVKPGTGVLVGYRLAGRTADGPVELRGYVRGLDPTRARTLAAKWSRMRSVDTPFGPGVRLLADGRTVLFLFPNDARLRRLRFVTEPRKLKRILTDLPELRARGLRVRGRRSTLRLVRYKPERRYIASGDLGVTGGERGSRREVFLRFFPDDRGGRIAETSEALRRQAGASLLPRPLGAVLHGRLFVEERVGGREILEEVLEGTGDGAALARSLRELHGAEPPPSLAARRPSELVARLAEGLGVMTSLEPGLRPEGAALLEALARAVPEPEDATVHGDLHLHQVLVGDRGPVFVDLERAAVGHPLQDVGDLVAHLRDIAERTPERRVAALAFERSFLDEYMAGRDPRGLEFFVAAALASRALLPFRRVEDGWRERSWDRLALARSALGKDR
jgi:streptomycin 6-kinase